MNPMMILKGAKLFAIIGVVAFALYQINDFRKQEQAETDALITANATAVSAEAKAQVLATANAQLREISKAQTEALRLAAEAQAAMQSEFAEIKKTQLEQKALLEGDRLANAVRGKRELVERLSNRATRERFDEVEEIFDGS